MHQMKLLIGRALSALAALSLLLAPIGQLAHADVTSEMNSYYHDMSAASYNVTGPTAYNSQAGGYLSGGSIYARFPQKNLQLYNLQMPRISAGCGGIDIFTGSFSFVNSDQMIAMAKAVINSAEGYVFKLAIHALSGLIGDTLDDIEKKVEEMTAGHINSCKLAESAVNHAFDAMDLGSALGCQEFASAQGYASDWSAAVEQCTTDSGRASVENAAQGATDPNGQALAKNNTTLPHNVTWQMLSNSPEFKSRDQQFREMLMSLVGTITYGQDAGGNKNVQFYGSDVHNIFAAIMFGTDSTASVQILSCGSDTTNCLNPGTQQLSIKAADSIYGQVRQNIVDMQADITGNQPVPTQIQQLLQNTHIPLYRILVVFSAKQGTMNSGDVDNLAQLASFDLVDRMLTKMIHDIGSAQQGAPQADEKQFAQWREQYTGVVAELMGEREKVRAREDALQGWIQRTSLLETTLQNDLSSQMQASIGFAHRLRGSGI